MGAGSVLVPAWYRLVPGSDPALLPAAYRGGPSESARAPHPFIVVLLAHPLSSPITVLVQYVPNHYRVFFQSRSRRTIIIPLY